MANADNAKGFYPAGHLTGGEIRTLPFTAAGTIYKGDAVTAGSDGTITSSTADDGAAVCGAAAEYGVSGDVIAVWADPDIIFGIQASAAATIIIVYSTLNHTAGSGNALTKLSGDYLAGGGGQCQIIGLIDAPDNVWGANQDVMVIFAEHAFNTRASI